jgi:hypothetical protein
MIHTDIADALASNTSDRTPPAAFPEHERRLLLGTPGISHGVVARIEQEGVCTLRDLLDRGIDAVVNQICLGEGNLAWRNRRRALARALASLDTHRPG